MTIEAPYTGGEKENLRFSVERHRQAIRWKLEGLDEAQLRRSPVASGTTLIGLVKHLAAVEYGWFCHTFGRPVEAKCEEIDAHLETDPDWDLKLADTETTQEIVEFYERACAAANAAIDETDLETVGTSWSGRPVSMRWVLVHMIEETARHAGHVDIIRELIDGATGDHNRPVAPEGS